MNDLLFAWEIVPTPVKFAAAFLLGAALGLVHAWLRHLAPSVDDPRGEGPEPGPSASPVADGTGSLSDVPEARVAAASGVDSAAQDHPDSPPVPTTRTLFTEATPTPAEHAAEDRPTRDA